MQAVVRTAVDAERELIIDNLLVQIHFIIVIIRWIGLAPSPFPGSLTSTFRNAGGGARAVQAVVRAPVGALRVLAQKKEQ